MAAPNIYQELKSALSELKTFLDTNAGLIKPAITTLAAIVPQVNDLITELISLLNRLKTEIENLNIGVIEGLDKVTSFTTAVKGLLETTKRLLPNESSAIDGIIAAADVVTGLPTFDNLKEELTTLLTELVVHLNQLKSA